VIRRTSREASAATVCRRHRRPNHDTQIRLPSQKTHYMALPSRHHGVNALACSLQALDCDSVGPWLGIGPASFC
jgi:hypothetical protein